MRSEIPLSHQTIYAELLSQCAADAFKEAFAEEGTFVSKTIKDRRYWYFQLPAAKGGEQRYAGPETPELLEQIKRHKEERHGDRQRRALVSALVRSAALSRMLQPLGTVIDALAKAGVFRLRAVLVGTTAYQTYSAMLGTRLPQALLQTNDVDVAQYSAISIATEDSTQPMLEVLRTVDPRFRPVPHMHDGRRTTKYQVDGGVSVDFLTPNEGPDTDEPTQLRALGTDAEPLRFLGFLIREPEPAVVLHEAGIYVLVPSPQRYAIHKLIIAQRRPIGSPKSAKDLKQAEALLDVLADKRPQELRDAWREAIEPSPPTSPARGWRDQLSKGLSLISGAVRDKTLRTLGYSRSLVAGLDLRFNASPARYDSERDVVAFWGEAAGERVQCMISREALDDHFKPEGRSDKERLDIFNRNRSRIETMARAKYLYLPIEEQSTLLIRTLEVPKLTKL